MSKLAIAGGVLGAALLAAANLTNPRPENEFCAIDGDGSLVSSTDGVNFRHLNSKTGDTIPDAAYWVEGRAGWGRGPICVTRDVEFQMPMKDFPNGARVLPREPEFDL